MIVKIFLVVVALASITATPVKDDYFQVGCVKCRNTDKSRINVHLVPHSHDDVGWLKTVDEYYYGLENSISKAGVQYIISSVVNALTQNPDRRFIQVETAFFWKWWKTQSQEMRDAFKSLVDNGQIEMVNGGWSMNDEACTNYQSTIDQFTWGLKTLEDTLGECGRPRVGWQIDPFGHSREQASIVSQLGFDGVIFSRLDHDDKNSRLVNKSLDFAWQGSTNIGDSVIFGSIFPTRMYYPPDGFCWDYTCSDNVIDDNKESADYNLDTKKKEFREVIKQYATFSTTNNILIPMGGDFQYQAAQSNFINMDLLIESFKGDDELNVFYSTPSCYIQAVNNANVKLSLKTDDFFPYSETNHSYWTGYFSSRPALKRYERIGHNLLQVSKQVISLYAIQAEINDTSKAGIYLTHLREAIGVMQHHDAITGTEKQAVAEDYARLLSRGMENAEKPLGAIASYLLTKGDHPNINHTELAFSTCPLANITICNVTRESRNFVVAIYNPLAWTTTHYVRLPVSYYGTYEINGPDGPINYQQVPAYNSDFNFDSFGTTSSFELVFAAKDLPPMGFRLYHVSQKRLANDVRLQKKSTAEKVQPFTLDPKTKLLSSVTLGGITANVTQNFYTYPSSDDEKITSGAYVFRPAKQVATEIRGKIETTEFDGDVVYEIQQKWKTDFAKLAQSIKWYRDTDYLELDWTISDISQDTGNEVITRFTVADLNNAGIFYTDSNGRETLKRTRNVHPGYDYDYTQEPVSSNYYPVTSAIAIKDKELGVAILNDRAQGGSSLRDGEIELMIHRRLLKDDGKGVDEILDEINLGNIVRGSHYLTLGSTRNSSNESDFIRRARILAQKRLNQPLIGFAATEKSYSELNDYYNMEYSALDKPLPTSVNILSFEPWKENTFLLRLEHILEKEEAEEKSVEVNLENLFKNFKISSAVEKTLGANEDLESFRNRTRYSWKLDKNPLPTAEAVKDSAALKISLTPMQIRTFEVEVGEREPASGGVKVTFSLSSTILLVITLFGVLQ